LKGIAEPVSLYAASGPSAVAVGVPPPRAVTRPLAAARRHPRRAAALGLGAAAALGLAAVLVLTTMFGAGVKPSASAAGGSAASSGALVAAGSRSSERIVWSVEHPADPAVPTCWTGPFDRPLDARLWMMDPDGKNQLAILPT